MKKVSSGSGWGRGPCRFGDRGRSARPDLYQGADVPGVPLPGANVPPLPTVRLATVPLPVSVPPVTSILHQLGSANDRKIHES